MNTNFLKRFATEARAKLRAGVATKIKSLGFDADGNAVPGAEPTKMVGGCTWNGQILPSAFAEQWEALRHRLKAKGVKEVVEEGAYTWFNRLIAIRILAMNGISEPMLRFVDEARTPKILDDARQGRVIPMSDQQLQRLRKLFDDSTRISEQFALLITEFCHQTPILQACFGSLEDYTELLLPNNILDKDGFIDMINAADFITDEDYKSAELIGWLYQFYISDRKDEVFAKKGKVEADEIPAATQIFTPNWIVKYMVQNAIVPQVRSNRLPEEDKKYLINDEVPEEPKKPKDLKVADLACGSGHILNECFNLLFDLYIASGYGRADAIESIFRNNLVGIDIDERARQLATFALMLKACQRDESFADAHILPKILTAPEMPELVQNPKGYLPHFFLGNYDHEIDEAWEAVNNAHTLGSIIKFNISPATRFKMEQKVNEWRSEGEIPHGIQAGLPVMDFILALTDSYDAIVMNPPYMPTSRVDLLKEYATKNYPDSKADLFSVFMDVCIDRLKEGGKYGMINMQSWMFLSSFETLRKKILDTQHIDSLLHLGPRTFDELSGEVVQNAAFVITKATPQMGEGMYYRLVGGKNCASKCDMYRTIENRHTVVDQKQFEQIPGTPIAYWLSNTWLRIFSTFPKITNIAKSCAGAQTGDTQRFIRLWHEIDFRCFDYEADSPATTALSSKKWFKYNKGGEYRKWYGIIGNVVYWENNGAAIKNNPGSCLRNQVTYFIPNISWSNIVGKHISMKYIPGGYIYDIGAFVAFPKGTTSIEFLLGLGNSKIVSAIKPLFNPTIHFTPGDYNCIPIPEETNYFDLNKIVADCIAVSKQDWDAHETSWDFKTNELVALGQQGLGCITATINNEIVNQYFNLEMLMTEYKTKWETLFYKLHSNEEELNRQFIEIYGLQDELTPDVPLDEITILQQGEISIVREQHGAVVIGDRQIATTIPEHIEFNLDVIIKQLISYMVGVWMGRYRLDRPGLNIAHPNPTDEELASYQYGPDNATLRIDDDAIIPILPAGAPFEDNLSKYIADFVRIAWGEASQTDNLNFIEKCLGKKIEDYVQKDFWKDHKKMYQNRPIYWLFSSKKGAFKALVYVHRMHPYTVEQIRTRYLLKYMDWLRNEAQRLEIRDADLTTAERRRLDRLRSDIEECEEYHERLQVVAENAIPIDLDNGIPANHALFGDIVTKLR